MEAKNIFKQPRAKAKQTCTMSNLVGFNRNTELCIDLKTILRSDRKAKTHKDYPGVLTRDGREHFTFIETVPQAPCRRNLRVFDGKYITITRRSDGSLWPNF